MLEQNFNKIIVSFEQIPDEDIVIKEIVQQEPLKPLPKKPDV
jgi:hypothetical protein